MEADRELRGDLAPVDRELQEIGNRLGVLADVRLKLAGRIGVALRPDQRPDDREGKVEAVPSCSELTIKLRDIVDRIEHETEEIQALIHRVEL